MIMPTRCAYRRPPFSIAIASRRIHLPVHARRLHQLRHDPVNNDNVDESRSNAIQARSPSYAGWWTEVMDYSQRLHSAADPARFQGQSAQPETPTSTVPTPDEAKKGYSNTLQSAAAARAENTLPTATSRGSTLSQPAAAKANVYHGFVIPIKPTPPGAEDCCMSGCAHCVYDIYEEDRQDYKRELSAILKAIETAGLPPPPANTIGGATASGQDGKGVDDDMDPSMKAFLKLERKLKGT